MISFQPAMSENHSARIMRDRLRLTRPWANEEKLDRLVVSLSKDHIHQAVAIAIKREAIALSTRCSICPASTVIGTARRIVAHHDDYNKPLSIRWLCTRCHADWHRQNEPIPMAFNLEGLTRYQYFAIGMGNSTNVIHQQIHEGRLSPDTMQSLEFGGELLWEYCVEASTPRLTGRGDPCVY